MSRSVVPAGLSMCSRVEYAPSCAGVTPWPKCRIASRFTSWKAALCPMMSSSTGTSACERSRHQFPKYAASCSLSVNPCFAIAVVSVAWCFGASKNCGPRAAESRETGIPIVAATAASSASASDPSRVAAGPACFCWSTCAASCASRR